MWMRRLKARQGLVGSPACSYRRFSYHPFSIPSLSNEACWFCFGRLRLLCYNLTQNPWFERLVLAVIVFNTLVISASYFGMVPTAHASWFVYFLSVLHRIS